MAQDAEVQDRTRVELTTSVPGHIGISFFDLIKQAIPDLVRNENGSIGHRTVTLRGGKLGLTDRFFAYSTRGQSRP